ncbi:Hsp20/alpha crystallin family protein [Moorella sulfitireducens]|uniref:Hsp20/alpha crystallin family protein n=1 Tax=Neomoorella sulfitireducens TaxID=2972948 RepID=UPI0021AB9D3A|nr:Hsp20/alpha crystallin family protein [Moorella sulfitireducens]
MLQTQGHWPMTAMPMPGWTPAPADVLVAPVNVLERDNDIIYIFAVPGARPEDMRVEIRRQILEIKGNASLPGDGQYVYRYQEWPAGSFYRFVPLPPELDPEKAVASFSQGLLTVRFPKPGGGRQVAVNIQAPVQEQGQESTQDSQPGHQVRAHLI